MGYPLVLLLVGLCLSMEVQYLKLNEGWNVKILESENSEKSQYPTDIINKQLPTSLPTTIHLDLLINKQIQDPFYRDNNQHLQWISRSVVKYSKNFTISQKYLSFNNAIEIVFHGIDTYSTVVLNDVEILTTNNAFKKYTKRVQGIIQEDNTLQVTINPTYINDEKQDQTNKMPFKYAHTRKPCYQYSWDWAPYINTMGLWKEVEIRKFQELRFDYVWARNKLLDEKKAIINFAAKLNINTFKDESLSDGYKMGIFINGEKLTQQPIINNETTVYADVSIPDPQFWWPNGIGQPYIYDFEVKIIKNSDVIDIKKVPYGIRKAKLDIKDRQFKLYINGYPVYCKGANYVPPDMLYPRLTNPIYKNHTKTFEKLLNDAVQSNFNMIRIWGGGQYQSEQFLEMASRKGIMIFYDFMFSDSIYPSTANFLMNVEQEIKQQVRKTRNYPALVIWCGNNEILQGIEQWEWDAPNYRKDYINLFEILIPKILKIQNPEITYIPSSPIHGVGNKDFEKGGDFHYWGVWAGGKNFEDYKNAIGPFNSEFGTQGLPVWHTIKQFTEQDDRKYQSSAFLTHQRHNSQFKQLKIYMTTYMKPSKNFEMQAYLSGLLQAYALQIAISAQRMSKPLSYGTLYWQMNDAWPGISWSSIDYYGRWKPLQYSAKRLYTNIAIFSQNINNIVYAINDNLYPIEVWIKINMLTFSGQILQQKTMNITLGLNSIQKVHNYNPIQQNKSTTFLYCEIWYNNTLVMRHTSFFNKPKDLDLPNATLNVQYNKKNNQITLSSTSLIKNLFIDHETHYIKLSDNYFDLIPNVPYTVTIDPENSLSNLLHGLKYVSMKQASQKQGELDINIIASQ